ncbi:MAG: hypothetical protein HFF60_00230 [Oscillospiraceae bacterium]|jgi:hypothetical protein|nr:hypothetical protein [Oscillospiraceae bacterium]
MEEAGKTPAYGGGEGLPKEFLPSVPGFSKQISVFSSQMVKFSKNFRLKEILRDS